MRYVQWLSWASWSLLGQSHPYQLRVLDDLGTPVSSAVIDIRGSQAGTTGADGRVDLVWSSSSKVLEISAPGHVPQRLTLNDQPGERFEVVLKARVLRGRIVDGEGNGLHRATVTAGGASDVSDTDGYFQIRGAEEGRVVVERPAWQPTTFTWQGQTGESIVELEPFIARAVHISGESMRDDLDRFVDMAMDTELNALMIDLKDETGKVWYDSENQIAVEVGAVQAVFDLDRVVARSHDLGLYVIGRIVLFNDPIAAAHSPEMAVLDSRTNAPYESRGQFFLDPTDADARQYGLDLAVEACEAGLDEIQFDYVRFPDARSEWATFDGGVSPEVRLSTITGFLDSAVGALQPMGCAVAADIFGYLTTAKDDGGIGQRWEDIAATVDVVSPMLYPSHYDSGWEGFEVPSQFPGEMIDRALADGMERLPRQVVVRPWLQDFGYDAAQVREQIRSAEQYGLGWMLWNAASDVTVDALRPAE